MVFRILTLFRAQFILVLWSPSSRCPLRCCARLLPPATFNLWAPLKHVLIIATSSDLLRLLSPPFLLLLLALSILAFHSLPFVHTKQSHVAVVYCDWLLRNIDVCALRIEIVELCLVQLV